MTASRAGDVLKKYSEIKMATKADGSTVMVKVHGIGHDITDATAPRTVFKNAKANSSLLVKQLCTGHAP
eukprot:9836913-Lingulodinium_polyedra.AAC.1